MNQRIVSELGVALKRSAKTRLQSSESESHHVSDVQSFMVIKYSDGYCSVMLFNAGITTLQKTSGMESGLPHRDTNH